MMPSVFYVYIHSRMGSGEPFYVGKGCGKRHASMWRNNRHWRHIVAKDGGFYSSIVASGLDEEFAFLLERETIDKFRRLGVSLANRTDGGEGPSGMRHSEETKEKFRRRQASDETRQKLRERMLGYQPTDEVREKLRQASIGNKYGAGRKDSPETIERRAAKIRGQRRTPEQIERMNRARSKPTFSAETLAKMAERMKGNSYRLGIPHTEETKKRFAARRFSEETRRKWSESRKGRPRARKDRTSSDA